MNLRIGTQKVLGAFRHEVRSSAVGEDMVYNEGAKLRGRVCKGNVVCDGS